uniref:Superinfection immunity protein n=1 Tax=mine drainage metagenome TaxID=410659 RepID=E6Q4B6_9ZZZZ
MIGIAALIGVAVYFLPSIIAFSKNRSNRFAILAVNFFFGWTFLGWVIALIWALSVDREVVAMQPQQQQQQQQQQQIIVYAGSPNPYPPPMAQGVAGAAQPSAQYAPPGAPVSSNPDPSMQGAAPQVVVMPPGYQPPQPQHPQLDASPHVPQRVDS